MSKSRIDESEVNVAIHRAQTLLLSRQKTSGAWSATLYYNGWTSATYILTLYAVGALDDRESIDRAAHWLLEHQNSDGSWGFLDYRNGPTNLEITCQVVLALSVAGYADTDQAQRGQQFIDNLGGVVNVPFSTQFFYAVFGRFFWNQLPPLPI